MRSLYLVTENVVKIDGNLTQSFRAYYLLSLWSS